MRYFDIYFQASGFYHDWDGNNIAIEERIGAIDCNINRVGGMFD